jgi:hypothetical protein
MTEVQRKFWEKKLEIARANHKAEMQKMNGGGGASLSLLDRYASDVEKAKRKLAAK